MTTLASVRPEIDRDRFGRPLIIPPGGGKKIPYTRATTYADTLEDKYSLQLWQQRMVIVGLVDRPDLLLSAAAHRDDKAKLNAVADSAIEAAKARAAATVGTALHALTERIDAGVDIGPIPGEYQRDLDAYVAATAPLTVLQSEMFTVLDDLKIGGTPDRVVEYGGARYIADVKTGSIDYGAGKIAIQLAIYAHSVTYDHATGQRTPLPDGVNLERGIVIHLPAGTGTCQLVFVDIAAGWNAVALATQVRAWRSRKDLLTPFGQPDPDTGIDPILVAIAAARTGDELIAIWAGNQHNWRPHHTQAAALKKALV